MDAIAGALKGAIAEADKLNDMRLRFDIDAKSLMDLKYITSQTGTDLDTLGKGVKKLSKDMLSASEGSKSQAAMFQSLGIAVQDADGKLKGVTTILPEIADKFKAMNDPIKEAALAQELFGKSGTEMLETLNLGGEGMRQMAARAEELRGGLSDIELQGLMTDADAFNDHLGELQYSVQVLAMRVASELMPTIHDWIEGAIDWVTNGDNANRITAEIADTMRALALVMDGVTDLMDSLNTLLPNTADGVDQLDGATKSLTGVFDGLGSAAAFVNSILGVIGNTVAGVVNDISGVVNMALTGINTILGRADAADKYRKKMGANRANAEEASANIGDILNNGYFKDLQAQAAVDRAMGLVLNKNPRSNATQGGGASAPTGGSASRSSRSSGAKGNSAASQAQRDLQRSMDEISKSMHDWTNELAWEALEPFEKQYAKSLDDIAQKTAEFAKNGVSPELIKKYAETMKEAARTRAEFDRTEKLVDNFGARIAALQDEREALGLSNKELYVRAELKKLSELEPSYFAAVGAGEEEAIAAKTAALTKLRGEVEKTFDAKEVKKLADEAADAWMSVWDRAANEIGNIVSGIFNRSIRSFKDLMQSAKSLLSNLAGDIAGTFYQTKIKQPLMDWFKSAMTGKGDAQAHEWIGGLEKVFDGFIGKFKGVFEKLFPKSISGAATAGMSPQMAGMMKMAPWMGAAMGGMWGLQRGGDGVIGKAGSLTAGIVGGAGLSAGGVAAYGALAGGAGLMGAATAGLAAIPVAGWIALGASTVDKLTGGKLFGTSYKKESSAQGFNVTGSDASGFNSVTESKQKALFGGKKYRTTTSGLDAQAEAQVDSMFGQLMDSVNAAARQLGVAAPQALDASFQQQFDKDGNLTKEFGTILGKTYAETQDAFIARMVGENMLNVAKAAGSATEIDAIAEAYRGTGEQLQKFSSYMLAVQNDIKQGTQLWDTSALTLTQVTDAVERLAQAGESVAEAYARTTETARSYGALIGNVEAELKTSGLSDYQRSVLQVEMSYRQTVKQANALAKSLGLSGARTEDLTKIEMLRAQQMAALQKQQTDQRDAFISSLKMGDLSTLQDSEKLALAQTAYDKALQGNDLSAAQDALQELLDVGKRYYASGSDYKNLFDSSVSRLEGMNFDDTTLGDLADILLGLPDAFAEALYQKALEGDSFNVPILPLDSANTSGLDSANAGLALNQAKDTAILSEIRDELRKQSRRDEMLELRTALQ
ncbi:phage tail tape measure protein [Aquilutibacter rugosus]|uniref:phage tail tape measure protein n=1 Tax=Aquilutibacter rugosus TaxID=3115820 RepID=UPI002F40427E